MSYVCLCHGVTAREVRKQIGAGACTIAAIGAGCGAGTCCQGCHPTLEEILDAAATAQPLRRVVVA